MYSDRSVVVSTCVCEAIDKVMEHEYARDKGALYSWPSRTTPCLCDKLSTYEVKQALKAAKNAGVMDVPVFADGFGTKSKSICESLSNADIEDERDQYTARIILSRLFQDGNYTVSTSHANQLAAMVQSLKKYGQPGEATLSDFCDEACTQVLARRDERAPNDIAPPSHHQSYGASVKPFRASLHGLTNPRYRASYEMRNNVSFLVHGELLTTESQTRMMSDMRS